MDRHAWLQQGHLTYILHRHTHTEADIFRHILFDSTLNNTVFQNRQQERHGERERQRETQRIGKRQREPFTKHKIRRLRHTYETNKRGSAKREDMQGDKLQRPTGTAQRETSQPRGIHAWRDMHGESRERRASLCMVMFLHASDDDG